MEHNFLEPAFDDCINICGKYLAENLQKKGIDAEVKLGIISVDNLMPDVVWYARYGSHLEICRTFKGCAFRDIADSLKRYGAVSTLYNIRPDDYFLHETMLYRYDAANGLICKVTVCGHEALAQLWAEMAELEPVSCSLVKLLTVQDTKFVTVSWLITDQDTGIAFLPVFADDHLLLDSENGEELTFNDLNYKYLEQGDVFLHDGWLWTVKEDAQQGTFI